MTVEEPAPTPRRARRARVVRRVGDIVVVLGLLAAASGYLLERLDDGPDANIGAGILVVVGLPLAMLGAVVLVVGVVLTVLARQTD